jgi:hypothetical protein
VKRRADVVRKDVGSETILLGPDQGTLHVMNQTTVCVWDTLASASTTEEIERALRTAFDVPEDMDVRADVERIVGEFRSAGLIEDV